jgi:hypothetical protein
LSPAREDAILLRVIRLCALLLPILLAGSAAATERPREPSYDCTEQRSVFQPILQGFRADEISAWWYVDLGDSASLNVSAYTWDGESPRALLERSMLDPSVGATFSVSTYKRTNAAVEIRAGDRTLAPQPLVWSRHSGRSAPLQAAQLASLLSEGTDLLIVFRDGQGNVVQRATVSNALLRTALDELAAMFRRVLENMADPPNRCGQMIEWSE